MGQIFYIADPHFSHQGVLRTRPGFTCVEEVDWTMLTAWRRRVKPGDTVYIIGDLFGFRENLGVLEQLTGQLVLIRGNHEQSWLHHIGAPERYFQRVEDTAEITDGGRTVRMCHFPQAELYPQEENAYLLYGHLHASPPRRADWRWVWEQPRALNVSADIAQYTGIFAPATLDEWIFFNQAWKASLPRE